MAQAPNLQIVGGGFQDAEGNPLANGYLLFELSPRLRVFRRT